MQRLAVGDGDPLGYRKVQPCGMARPALDSFGLATGEHESAMESLRGMNSAAHEVRNGCKKGAAQSKRSKVRPLTSCAMSRFNSHGLNVRIDRRRHCGRS